MCTVYTLHATLNGKMRYYYEWDQMTDERKHLKEVYIEPFRWTKILGGAIAWYINHPKHECNAQFGFNI